MSGGRDLKPVAPHRRARHGKKYALAVREQVIAARMQGFGPTEIGKLVGLTPHVCGTMIRNEAVYHKRSFPPIRRAVKPIRRARVDLSHAHGVTAKEMAEARGMSAAEFLSTLLAQVLESPVLAANLMDDDDDQELAA